MWAAILPIIGVLLKGFLEIWMALREDSIRNRKKKEELRNEIDKAIASRDPVRLNLVISKLRHL